VKREKERRVDTKRKASPKKDFTFFFIWQAIVRGRLFLQRTFFLLPPSPLKGELPYTCIFAYCIGL
jgi:hypothetical protein